jgi:uncharacterized protein YndB with AHSA1/START domain
VLRMSEPVSISREISASPEQLYAMVSDVTRMGEWSPENEGGEWLGGATTAQSGAKFRSTNRVDKKSWKTVATVVDAEPGRRFAFRVSAGPVKVSEWGYTFDTTPNGCRVTESWSDLRPGWFKPVGRLATGVSDRATHNRTGMEQTLQRLATVAKSPNQPS